jgi:hypothetical protein
MIGDIPYRVGDTIRYGFDPYPHSDADMQQILVR